MSMTARVFVLLVVCSVAAAADRETFTARVVSIHDGDCVTVLRADNRQTKLRLAAIDAPELKQPFGSKARDHLAALVMGKQIGVVDHGPDRYGRTLAHIKIEGQDVNRAIIEAGMAWHYVRYSKAANLAAAERGARAAGRGLWADREPVPPWEWRASERDRKAAARQPAGR